MTSTSDNQVNVLPDAVERFQQRGGGHPAPERARQELLGMVAPTVRAARRPPGWCSTRPADFYLATSSACPAARAAVPARSM